MKQKGFISTSVVLLTSILSILLLYLRTSGTSSTWLSKQNALAIKAKDQSLYQYQQFLSDTQLLGLKCYKSTYAYCALHDYRSLAPQTISTFIYKDTKEVFPHFNYTALLKPNTKCSNTSKQNLYYSLQGKTLSKSSFLSEKTCKYLPTTLEPTILKENISISGTSMIGGLLASRGYIEIKTLIINESSIVIAGGDLLIENIISDSRQYLTLISASGNIYLKQLSDQLAVRVYTIGTAELPSNIKFSDLAPLPNIALVTHLATRAIK